MATNAFAVAGTVFASAGIKNAHVVPFRTAITKAAAASLASFSKHITPHLAFLKLAIRFNVRTVPVVPREFTPAFFGVSATACVSVTFFFIEVPLKICYCVDLTCSFRMEYISEYQAYMEEYADHTAEEWAAVNNFKFWHSKEEVWPHLANIAMTCCEIPLSSIAAERVFAQARIVDAPQRRNMSWETFNREVFLRTNRKVLLRMMGRTYDALL
jgi:hypothetical protein